MRVIKSADAHNVIRLPVRHIDPSWRTYQFALIRAEHRRKERRRVLGWVLFYGLLVAGGIGGAYLGAWIGSWL